MTHGIPRTDDDRLRALGRVVANGVACEQLTTMILAGLISGNRDRLMVLLGGLGWSQQIDRVRALAKIVLADDLERRVARWAKCADSARLLRNGVIHSAYTKTDDGAEYSVSMPRGQGFLLELASDAKINTAADALRDLYAEGQSLIATLSASDSWDDEAIPTTGPLMTDRPVVASPESVSDQR